MKRILLSTVILFGTLSSINAAAEAVAADYHRGLRVAFVNLDRQPDPLINQEALNAIHDSMIEATSIHALSTFEREKDVEAVIKRYFNEVIDYKPFVCSDVRTPQNMLIFVIFLTVNSILVWEGSLYPALPPMAGASIFALANLFVYASVLYAKEYGLPARITCGTGCRGTAQHTIQDRWQRRLSNPEVKACLAKILSYILVSKKWDISEKTIQRQLDALFLEANSFTKIFEILFPDHAAEDRV